MADNSVLAMPGKPLAMVKAEEKNRAPMSLAERLQKLLGIANWSELIKGDEPYFGF
jgi:hypothetical protein